MLWFEVSSQLRDLNKCWCAFAYELFGNSTVLKLDLDFRVLDIHSGIPGCPTSASTCCAGKLLILGSCGWMNIWYFK